MENEFEKHIDDLEQDLEFFQEKYQQIQSKIDSVEEVKQDLEKHVNIQASNIDFEKLESFVNDQYWLINEIDDEKYEVWIPQFMDVQAGVLDRQKGGYNVFILDQTTKMISGIPEFLQDQVDLDSEQSFKVKGDLLEFDEDKKEVVEEQLGDHVEEVKDDRATIKDDHGYSLVRDLLDRGEIPFTPTPVSDEDLRPSETEHELRSYQQDALDQWHEHGAITIAFMTGSGKTHIGIEAFDELKFDSESGRKAVVAFNKITANQWEERIEKYAPRMKAMNMSDCDPEDIPMDEEVVEIYNYHSLHKLEEMINQGYEYIMIQFDEADFLPAKTFSKASTYPTKYRMGHTASPVRSKENPNDTFALCGRPVGMNWKDTLEHMENEMFPVNIHVVSDRASKIERLESVLEDGKSTLIIVEETHEDSIGQEISEKLGIDFIHGKTSGDQKKQVQEAIEEDNVCIVSRIGRRGMSLPSVQRLIEVDRRGDSWRDVIQAIGRLFHGLGEQADMIYTVGEANKFEDTFKAILSKGFQMNDVDDALATDKLSEKNEGVVDLDIEGGEKVVPETGEESYNQYVTGYNIEDDIDFLKHDKIQDILDEAMEGYSKASTDDQWDVLIALADSDDGLTSGEISSLFPDSSKQPSRYVKPARDVDVLIKEGGKYKLNSEEIKDIIDQYEETQDRKRRIEELKQDVRG